MRERERERERENTNYSEICIVTRDELNALQQVQFVKQNCTNLCMWHKVQLF
jgi:hypothetical protein